VPVRRDLPLALPLPPWDAAARVQDVHTGSLLPAAYAEGRARIVLPELKGWRLLWAPARDADVLQVPAESRETPSRGG
jgi:hypothetical protein